MSAPHDDDVVLLVHDAIDAAALIQFVRAETDGAIVTFDGFVRNESHGRRALYLDYDAYESMAMAKMSEIAAQVREKYAIHRVAIVHRLGRLQVSETSVFIAVSAAHRAAAFDACRFAIDTLKRTVPIWKKEYFEDGAVWADGELPPVPSNQASPPSSASPGASSGQTPTPNGALPAAPDGALPPVTDGAPPPAPAATPAAKPAS
ncbi:MAG TPA: molybdenum cofactor biosynthesis protein MoaE [Candidatus Dormibacteraeota bacterium]|nr:molybdenum cofactor biosynthesis protein MoaE [Candidatus Dormibacteraeota bacterium]